MQHRIAWLGVALFMVMAVSASAADIVGKWEGKDNSGKVVAMEFKADGSMEVTDNETPPGVKFSYKLNAEKTPLEIDVTMVGAGPDGKEVKFEVPMLAQLDGNKLTLVAPKGPEGKRPTSLEDGEKLVLEKK